MSSITLERPFKKVLLIRLDRLGDLIVTVPVDQLLKDVDVTWFVPKGAGFVTFYSDPKRRAFEIEKKFQFSSFLWTWRFLKNSHFDAAVIFHSPWWMSFCLWIAKVPIRVGVKSQWHSYLFLNRGIRQKRSQARFHELEYNKKLLVEGLDLGMQELVPLVLRPLEDPDLLLRHALKSQEYVVIHPGMGGSARNWPVEHYARLIGELSKKMKVVVSMGAGDAPWVEPIHKIVGVVENVNWLTLHKTEDWLTLLKHARALVAPSTGTAHIAASLGTKVIGIYSPVLVQSPRRWGPLGPRVTTLVPKADCPGTMSCLMEKCPHFDCMRTVSVDQILELL